MEANQLVFGFVSALLLAVAGVLTVPLTRNHRATLGFQQKLWLVSFLARFSVSFLLYGAGLAESIVGGGDDSGWYGGVGIMEQWEALGIGPFSWPVALLEAYQKTHQGYLYLLAVYFSITRMPSQLAAAALDCFCGALGVVVVYRTARLLFSEEVARKAGWWTCYFPLMIIWSAQSIKEPVVILLEALALYACVVIRANGITARHALLATTAILVLPTFRFYAAYITGAAILLPLALPLFGGRKTGAIAAIVVPMAVLPLLSATGALARHEETFETFTDVERIASFRGALATGEGSGSGVKTRQDMHTTTGLGLATLNGAVHLLLAPFPWEVRLGSLRMALTLPEMIVWWVLVYRGVVPGFKDVLRNRFGDMFPILLFLAGLGLVYSLTFGNVGLIYRQRAQLLPYFLIFAASGLELRRQRTAPSLSQPVPAAPPPRPWLPAPMGASPLPTPLDGWRRS